MIPEINVAWTLKYNGSSPSAKVCMDTLANMFGHAEDTDLYLKFQNVSHAKGEKISACVQRLEKLLQRRKKGSLERIDHVQLKQ